MLGLRVEADQHAAELARAQGGRAGLKGGPPRVGFPLVGMRNTLCLLLLRHHGRLEAELVCQIR